MKQRARRSLLERLVLPALLPGQNHCQSVQCRVYPLRLLEKCLAVAIGFSLACGFGVFGERGIEASPLVPPHDATNHVNVFIGDARWDTIGAFELSANDERQRVCEAVVFDATIPPQLKPMTDDATNAKRQDVGKQREYRRELLWFVVENVLAPLLLGIVGGYVVSWIHWNFFT